MWKCALESNISLFYRSLFIYIGLFPYTHVSLHIHTLKRVTESNISLYYRSLFIHIGLFSYTHNQRCDKVGYRREFQYVYMKKDICRWKETYKRDPHIWKETYRRDRKHIEESFFSYMWVSFIGLFSSTYVSFHVHILRGMRGYGLTLLYVYFHMWVKRDL